MKSSKILLAFLCLIGMSTYLCHAQNFEYFTNNRKSFDLKFEFVPNSPLLKLQIYKYDQNNLRLQMRDARHVYVYNNPISNYLIKNNITLNLQDLENGQYIIEIWQERKLVLTKTIIKEHLVLVKPLEVENVMLVSEKF